MNISDKGISIEVLKMVEQEDASQILKWGVQSRTPFEWLTYTTEELGELADAVSEHAYRRVGEKKGRDSVVKEAVQVATLALKIATMYSEHP
jgi:NTP pyrophosphatase (non-canonical NTP hydrolase)